MSGELGTHISIGKRLFQWTWPGDELTDGSQVMTIYFGAITRIFYNEDDEVYVTMQGLTFELPYMDPATYKKVVHAWYKYYGEDAP